MSPWDDYLAGFSDPARRQQAIDWLESRPESIRDLCRRYPPGSRAMIQGRTAHVVGYGETTDEPGLLFSFTDPATDFDRAVASRFFVCADHLRDSDGVWSCS